MKRWVYAMTVAVVCAALTGACSSGDTATAETSGETAAPTSADTGGEGAEAPEPLRIGFVVKSLSVDFWLKVVDGAEAAAEELGGNIEILDYAPASESAVEEQVNQVDNLISAGVDAMVVAPVAPVQLLPALQRAVDAGIPVVVLDTRVEGFEDQQTAYVGTDNFNGGVEAGKFIVEQLGGEGTLGLINGTPGVPAVDDRIAGVRDAVDGTGVEVVQELAAIDCTRDKGVTAAEDLLTAHPDVDAVFVACGEATVGAGQAIRMAGRDWGSIVLVGFDAAPDELASVKAGEERATIAQDQAAMGGKSLEAAVRAARGEAVEETDVDPGVQVVTQENVDQFM